MSKKKSSKSIDQSSDQITVNHSSTRVKSSWLAFAVCTFLSLVLYGNTLLHQYAQDDAIVIYDNMFTTDGVSGIPGLLKHDTFYGFFKEEGKANLVSGGRYRPLTPILFALEWQLFGNNPAVGHLMNMIWYAMLGFIIFLTIKRLINNYDEKYQWVLALLVATIFIAHPIHTEAVANIKGRDEILCMIGSMLSLYFVLRNIDTGKKIYMLWSGLALLLGLLSKENAITFLAVVPLALVLFRKQSIGTSLLRTTPLLIAAIIFLLIRTSVLGWDFGASSAELMNNPYIKIVDGRYLPFTGSEKFATILFTLGKYVQLLFFPHPLTHDYYPRHVDMMSFSDPSVLLSVVMYVCMLGFAFLTWKKNKFLSFGILYFIITLSIVSNVVFPIGTNMSERFLFMPSLGFCLILAAFLIWCYQNKRVVFVPILIVVFSLYSLKTYTRNQVWKDDFTLFTSDISISKNSAKLNNAVGGALSDAASKELDEPQKVEMLNKAILHLNKAIELHPNYKNPYLILGNCYHYLKDYEEAASSYNIALSLDSNFDEASNNAAINYRELGKEYGAVKGDLSSAIKYLNLSLQLNAKDYETLRLLGIAHGNAGDHGNAVSFFEKALQLLPNSAEAMSNLAKAYGNNGNESRSQELYNKAKQIDPNVLSK